jgi:MFS family permease
VGLAVFAPSPAWFYLVFALSGANLAAILLSGLMIALEFCDESKRPTYIGLNNTVRGLCYGVAPIVGGWLAGLVGYQVLFAIASGVGLAGVALLRWSVREPRHARLPVSQLQTES